MVPSIYGENMFDEFFDNNGFFGSHSPLFGKNSKNLMKTDIRETDDAKAYRFAVELPGFKKDEISLDIKDGYLTIAAQKGVDKDGQRGKLDGGTVANLSPGHMTVFDGDDGGIGALVRNFMDDHFAVRPEL